ncbi:hypothetical protein GC163_12110 [bacterium]|nr:hypothetical protein [bacterium]
MLLVVVPWLFGGVDPFSQTLIFPVLLLAVAGTGFSECLAKTPTHRFPTCAIPAVLLVAFGWVQTWNIGPAAMTWLSPTTQNWRTELLSEPSGPTASENEPLPASSLDTPATISVNPSSTRREMWLLLAGLTAYGLAMRNFSGRSERRLLTAVVAMNGAAIAYFSLVQMMSWNGQLFWSVPIEGTTPYGPFVNRNAGGGFQVMTLAACAYLASSLLGDGPADDSQRQLNHRAIWQTWLPPRHVCLWTLLAVLVMLVAGITLSLSRGAWLGAVVGVLTVLLFVRPQQLKWQHFLTILGLLTTSAGLLTWLSLTDVVRQRIPESTAHVGHLDGRLELWGDILRMIPAYWRTGSGLGTFGLVQPIYQQRPMLVWSDQAENLFLQILVEEGIPGLLLLCLLVVWAGRILLTAARSAKSSELRALIGLGLYLIASQATCASLDFGLRYPANQLTLAVLLGATLGSIQRLPNGTAIQIPLRCRRTLLGMTYLTLAVLLGVAWREMAWSGGIELAIDRGDSLAALNEMSEAELDDLETALTILLADQPQNAEGQLRRADLDIQRYRRAAMQDLLQELGENSGLSEEELWEFTSLATVRREAMAAAKAGDDPLLEELRTQPLIQTHLGDALQRVELARAAGPFLFRTHQLLAELSFLRGDPRHNSADVMHAVQLVPQQPDVRFWAGDIDFQAGRIDSGCINWQVCLQQTSRYDREICATAIVELPVETFVRDVLPNDVTVLARLMEAGQLQSISASAPDLLGQKLIDAATGAAETQPERAYVNAWGFELLGQADESVQHLQRALALAPERTGWRLLLADRLLQLGKKVEALREAEVALRLNPASAQAQQKLTEILQLAKP